VATNTIGTLNVLRASLAEAVARVVHTSTSEVYGTARYVPMDEDHPLQAQSPYAATKIAADKLAESFHLSFALPVATVRPFNTYGPRQSARAVIPTILTQLAAGADQLKLGSLAPIRDFTYVKDTVRGFLAVAQAEATVGQVTNLGTGTGISVQDLFDTCCQVAGRQAELAIDDQRVRPANSEVLRLICANGKALELTGWQPSFTLRDGLADTYAYIRDHIDLYHPERYAL
jgi:nucleoside-diphosphate-sugar epimerase